MDKIINQFLKPAKLTYHEYDLGLRKFSLGDAIIQRQQLSIHDVPFSYYSHQQKLQTENEARPVVIYIHSFNSNKIQVRGILNPILQSGFNVLAMQLQRVYIGQKKQPKLDNQLGSISFGFYEYQQIKYIVKWVKISSPRSKIVLWGRSMGAICAIKYQGIYQGADKLVLDSPFHDLQQVFMVKARECFNIPEILTKGLLKLFESQITQQFKFEVKDLKMLPYMNFCTPTVFVCNKNDSLAGKSTDLLYKQCSGPKQLIYTESSHSEERQKTVIQDILKFLNRQKRVAKIRKIVGKNVELKKPTMHRRPKSKYAYQIQEQNQSTQKQEELPYQNHLKSSRRKQLVNFEIGINSKSTNRSSNLMCFF